MIARQPLASASSSGQWLTLPERGTVLGLRMLLLALRLFGRRGARFVLAIVAFYYALFAREVNRASRAYLGRLYPSVTFPMVMRHIRTFADASLDRVLFALDQHHRFEIERIGQAHLDDLARNKRGALLLGAHLGSFEAMRALARREELRINVLVHFKNAQKINAMLRAVAPDFQARIIEIVPDDPLFVLQVQDRILAGELVAVLGDRVGLGERSVEVDFLGGRVRFPVGPYILAATLRCPIYLTVGLYHPPRRYSLVCEPFADQVVLTRAGRDQALVDLAQRYAQRLEVYARRAPYNWFNFFDPWVST